MSKISAIEHLKAFGERAKTFTTKLVGELAQNTVGAIEELARAKADKPRVVFINIPPYGWYNDGVPSYPECYDIMVEGVTDYDRVEITILPDSLETAKACGLCPTNETFEEIIQVRSVSVPSEDIRVECWIYEGKVE